MAVAGRTARAQLTRLASLGMLRTPAPPSPIVPLGDDASLEPPSSGLSLGYNVNCTAVRADQGPGARVGPGCLGIPVAG